MAVVGMANETNRLVSGYQVEIDKRFKCKLEVLPWASLALGNFPLQFGQQRHAKPARREIAGCDLFVPSVPIAFA